MPATPRPREARSADLARCRRRRRRVAGVTAAAAIALAGGAVLLHAPRVEVAARATTVTLTSDASGAVAVGSARDDVPRYGRDIRPILSDRCFLCHGTDEATRAVDLRLDVRASAIEVRDGAAAIVPGDAEASELWHRITTAHAEEVMPPPEAGRRPISDEERDLIRRWIDAGAEYESHWAFDPPARGDAPIAPAGADAWAAGDIDRFVLDRMLAAGVTPSPEADRPTLARRLFLDLTGLPPTIEELDAFLADDMPGAYERLVERLLTEEPYVSRMAERLAVPWLDAARYADTIGIHTDNGRQMWLYRDWVLAAFRDNMPYDRFLTEQLAGDLLPDATIDQRIASGFNRAHVITDEGGAINEEYLVEYAVDRVDTTSTVFLGITASCARCHDHKYDPITQDDYYSLFAYFNSIEEPGLYSQDASNPNRAFEPFLDVPSDEQTAELAALAEQVAALEVERTTLTPEEESERAEFIAGLPAELGLAWAETAVLSATTDGPATLTIDDTGTVVASGENPATDVHVIQLRSAGPESNLLRLDVLPDPNRPADAGSRVGRAANGNAVLSGLELRADLDGDGTPEDVTIDWAWSDRGQQNGDYELLATIDPTNPNGPGSSRGWAPDGHNAEGPRSIVLRLADPLPGGVVATLTLKYESMYANHVLAAVRPVLGRVEDARRLPLVFGDWYIAGSFRAAAPQGLFDRMLEAETVETIDFSQVFSFVLEEGGDPVEVRWRHDASIVDGQVKAFASGINQYVLARTVHAPVAVELPVSVGSDDGFRIHVNGELQASRDVARGAAPDQDRATLKLRAGVNTITFTVINTGGASGFYFRPVEGDAAYTSWPSDLGLALLPPDGRLAGTEFATRLDDAWAIAVRPRQREILASIAEANARTAQVRGAIPRTMVMKERDEPRPAYVLARGAYDAPIMERERPRVAPPWLGAMPEDAPADRLGLARWMTSETNPLVARVAANRLWMTVFGEGLVRTPDDFGYQGAWPTHPELLDWLAVELRESGWDMRHLVRLMVTSSTYRQSSVVRTEIARFDPANELLSRYPSRRLAAEPIRDQALYLAGSLAEAFGGAPVKPYQPEGLWQEVSMLQSNTRNYEAGQGDDLFRRSLYTYWKRAAPPPSMVAFDAPVRESCTIERSITNTPLQALVLWNDEQFVEAARMLAERVLRENPGADDADRLADLFRRCTSLSPTDAELESLERALEDFRRRWADRPEDAATMLATGSVMADSSIEPQELAAWSLLSSAVLNLHRTTVHP